MGHPAYSAGTLELACGAFLVSEARGERLAAALTSSGQLIEAHSYGIYFMF